MFYISHNYARFLFAKFMSNDYAARKSTDWGRIISLELPALNSN